MSSLGGPVNCDVRGGDPTVSGPFGDPELVRYGLIASAPAPSAEEVELPRGAVEVIVMWGDSTVLSVEHLSPVRRYDVGETTKPGPATPDYVMGAELLGVERLPVVLEVGGAPAVVIPAGATGDVSSASGHRDLTSIIASGRATCCAELAGAHQYPLSPGETARVLHRGFTFVVRPVQAGRAVGMGVRPLDAKRSAYTLFSFALHGLFLLAMYLMPPRSSALSLELLGEDARRATYLMQPPECIEEQTPSWLPSRDRAGGDGTRHDGADGQMGKQDSAKSKRKYAVAGPPDARTTQLTRASAEQEIKTAGILGVLAVSTGAWNAPSSPYATLDKPLGHEPLGALGALTGDRIGEDFGFGALGMRGTGRGGGGSGEGTIGAGALGTIGHGGSSGGGSDYGTGQGGFRSHKASVPRIRTGDAAVRGSLSKEVIRRVIQRHINEVRFCYEQALGARPDLAGRVQVRFVIAPTGAVQAAQVESSSLGALRAEQCIASAVRRWAFPAPEGGGMVIVSYPFVLESSGG